MCRSFVYKVDVFKVKDGKKVSHTNSDKLGNASDYNETHSTISSFEVLINPIDFPDSNLTSSFGYSKLISHVEAFLKIPPHFQLWLKQLAINGPGKDSRGGANSRIGTMNANTAQCEKKRQKIQFE